MNLPAKQKETQRLKKQTYDCRAAGIVEDFGRVMHTLLYQSA